MRQRNLMHCLTPSLAEPEFCWVWLLRKRKKSLNASSGKEHLSICQSILRRFTSSEPGEYRKAAQARHVDNPCLTFWHLESLGIGVDEHLGHYNRWLNSGGKKQMGAHPGQAYLGLVGHIPQVPAELRNEIPVDSTCWGTWHTHDEQRELT